MLKKLILLILAVNILTSCGKSCNDLNIDVGNIDVEINIKRMEQDLFEKDFSTIEEKHQFLINKYNELYKVFFSILINSGDPLSKSAPDSLSKFSSDTTMQFIYNNINNEFKDLTSYVDDLLKAFKYYKYYFPDSTIPEITTFYSNFNADVIEIDNSLCIALDNYLGINNEIVKNLPPSIPQYFKNKMDKQYLVADVMHLFLINRFSQNLGDDFISIIISIGKTMYLLDAVLPGLEDHIKMKYTKEELDWCIKNEFNIWKVIVDDNMIYSKNQNKIRKFTDEGPFTKGLPSESPSRVGTWIGLQIVRDYAKMNCLSPIDIIKEKNIQTILKSYKPDE